MNTTTQPETAIVTVEKFRGLDNQQPSLAQAWKVQRPERKLVGTKRSRSAGHLFERSDEDMVRAASRDAEACCESEHSVTHTDPRNQSRLRREGNPGGSRRPPELAIVSVKNSMNCWKPLRAVSTTAQVETPIAMVKKAYGLGNQPPSSVQEKVQRLGRRPVGSKWTRSVEHLFAGDDVVRAASKDAEAYGKRVCRNTAASAPTRRVSVAS